MKMALFYQLLLMMCLVLVAHRIQVESLPQSGYLDSGSLLRRHFPTTLSVKDKIGGHTIVVPQISSDETQHRQGLEEVDDFEDPDMMDFRDASSKSKRQQYDDYGHLRFGKRDGFDEYGHMRFGKRDHILDDYGHMRFGKRQSPGTNTNNNNNEEDYGHLRFGSSTN